MKKKILFQAITIFIIMLVALLINNKVEAATTYNDQISYTENYDGTISVQAAGKYIESAVIPSKINGKTVTTIAYSRI